jgi:hypothetical protein
MFGPEGSVDDAINQTPLPGSAAFDRTCRIHELIDAISAAVTNAQAGLNWLSAEPMNREEVRQSLNHVIKDGKRAADIVRLRALALVNEMPSAD